MYSTRPVPPCGVCGNRVRPASGGDTRSLHRLRSQLRGMLRGHHARHAHQPPRGTPHTAHTADGRARAARPILTSTSHCTQLGHAPRATDSKRSHSARHWTRRGKTRLPDMRPRGRTDRRTEGEAKRGCRMPRRTRALASRADRGKTRLPDCGHAPSGGPRQNEVAGHAPSGGP